MSNKAGWIKNPRGTIQVETVEQWVPGPGELLVRVEAASFNPIDAKVQRLDLFQSQYPLILGFTFAGTVVSTGPGIHSQASEDSRFGALQIYALALEQNTLRLEPETTFADSAGLIANLATVISALTIYMGLPKPPVAGTKPPTGKKILVYGGSSSVGGLAVQYATNAGYGVVTTSSAANRSMVEKRNPSHIIDHSRPDEDVICEIREHGPYEGIFDAIGSTTTTQRMVALLRETGGRFFSTSPSPGDEAIPAGIEKLWAGYSETLVSQAAHRELRTWYMDAYLPAALKKGTIWPNPALWLEGGLNSAQKALDLLYGGHISGQKVFINPRE
ncbi:alcohol dehydrogenase [Aspergillus costaricaensis CBS 115574]|uniref:Alcohol dehydrogenase n=1 Tax=Aspergillus costaricaensis CBS 115574 TaxID=1448317 RepID=A0ACD1IHB6_9EURO|nr:alcohol dehydrogenase [Aspergillus costaricaensis CBS 115574]RAK89710.1 alcohol dehydrogenase [Aspergillus costaricaensis CBS 115574]